MNHRNLLTETNWTLGRRDFLRASVTALFGLATAGRQLAFAQDALAAAPATTGLRFGLLTDTHYTDREPKGVRHYRESIPKAREAVAALRGQNVTFLAELGDLKDMADGEPDTKTLENLAAIEKEIQAFGGPTYHVLGNHDMDNLSKQQMLTHITNTGIAPDRSYYAFSHGGVRFIVLDACTTADGTDYDHNNFVWSDCNISAAQLAWLETELAASELPVIVLAHQRLDGEGNVFVNNAAQVRALLERHGRTLAVFMGHDHAGAHNVINGIHYYTLIAVVDGQGEANNSYAVVEVHPSLDITVTGYRRAVTLDMPRDATPAAAEPVAAESAVEPAA